MSAKLDPVPFTFVGGTTIDPVQVDQNFTQIVAQANARLAASGANADITSFNTVANFTVSGQMTAQTLVINGQSNFNGTAIITGDIDLSGALNVGSAVTLSGTLSVGGNTTVAGLTVNTFATVRGNAGFMGTLTVSQAALMQSTLEVAGSFKADANVVIGGSVLLGNATADTVYSGNGSVVLPYGSGVRATNTVSARGTLGTGGLVNSFNMTSATKSSTGIWSVSFAEPMQSNRYSVVASAATGTGSILCPVASNKTNAGFQLTFYNSSNAVADVSGECEIIVSGGL